MPRRRRRHRDPGYRRREACKPTRWPSVSVTMWRLRPLIFFPASKPRGPPLSVVFTDWLSITHGGRACLAPRLLARRHHQHVVDAREPAAARPVVEITLHGRIGRQILRQLAPLATRRGHVKDRVDHRAQGGTARPSDRRARWHQRLDQLPFRIGQVACVTQTLPHIVRASDFGPGHRDLQRIRKSDGITTS